MNLLLASYVFYAAWNPPFVLLLWARPSSTGSSRAALAEHATRAARCARFLLVISVAVNLGFIGFFKYGEFLLENFGRR